MMLSLKREAKSVMRPLEMNTLRSALPLSEVVVASLIEPSEM